MFQGLINIIKIDMSEFDSSSISNMEYMFSGCVALKELNLNNFDTSLVTYMVYLFNGCKSLTSLNLNSFNTQLVNYMTHMFSECSSLKYLNLYTFNTTRVKCVCYMFYNCKSLLYLNLFSFEETYAMTSYCGYTNLFVGINQNLKYCINYSKLQNIPNKISSYKNCGNVCTHSNITNNYLFLYNNECVESCPKGKYISSTNEYLCCSNYYDYFHVRCIDEIPIGYYLNDSYHKTIDKCDIKCEKCSLESISNNNMCISCNSKENYYPIFNNITNNNNSFYNCSNKNIEGYYFENETNFYMPCYFLCKYCLGPGDILHNNCSACYDDYVLNNNNCLDECHYYYYFDRIKNDYICTEKCPDDLIYIIEGNICVNDCSAYDLFSNGCGILNISVEQKDDLVDEIRRELLSGAMDELILKILNENKEDLIIDGNDIVYQITSPENQNNNLKNDRVNIQLGECETTLRDYYNISENDPLIIYKIDIHEEGLLIPVVEYEIYELKTKKLLNLSLCNETKIKVLFPANADSNNLEKNDPNSDYYNDECYSYSINGVDTTTTKRKSDFVNNNLSLCEVDCEYERYNDELNKSECNCEIKIELPFISEIVINKQKLFNKLNIKNVTNLKILKCYNVLFTKKGLQSNIGSYILLFIILINIICLILCFTLGYKSMSILISKLLCKPIGKNVKIVKNKNNTTNNTKVKKKRKKYYKNKVNNNINNNSIKMIIQINNSSKNNKAKNKDNPPKIKNMNNIKKRKNHLKKTVNKIKISERKKISKISSRMELNKYNNLETLNLNKNLKGSKIIQLNDYELNTLIYAEALQIDKRSYIHFYFSLLKRNQLFIFSFYTKNDYNLRSIKISKFFFIFALSYAINALFFTDENMEIIFILNGKFNIIYQIPEIIYSSLLSSTINTIIQMLAFSEKNLIAIKNENNKKTKRKKAFYFKKFLIIKFIIYFIVIFLLLGFSWYYISCFCAIYKNTQLYLIKDTLINFGFTCLYPVFLSLIPGIFRIPSLRAKKQDKECFYKFSKMIQYI